MAAAIVRRTWWSLDARISVYDDTLPTAGGFFSAHRIFSRANPVPLWRSVAFLDEARAKGTQVTFRAVGPDAERIIGIIRTLLEGPVEVLEEGFIDVF